ncbi:MAG: hypothetical protein IPI35_10535 [Deltaproteobacteria bacterium]|nr:hypothetical protein [Deltaproteobacteria bacterium]
MATLAANVNEADVVAVYSNGGFGGLHKKLLKALEDRFAEAAKADAKADAKAEKK